MLALRFSISFISILLHVALFYRLYNLEELVVNHNELEVNF